MEIPHIKSCNPYGTTEDSVSIGVSLRSSNALKSIVCPIKPSAASPTLVIGPSLVPKLSLICRASVLEAFSLYNIAKFAENRDHLTAEKLQSLESPLRPQLERWSKQPENHEKVAVGQQSSRPSGAALKNKLDELERRIETR